MALATQCPHCQTRFRVASDQLKLRGGIVRCGACQGIFDGSAHLIDLEVEAAAKAAAAPAAAVDAPPALPAPPAGSVPDDAALPATAAEPVYALDFSSTFDPPGILPTAEPAAAAVAAAVVDPAADPAPQDPEPPQGDVLAAALDAVAQVDAEAGDQAAQTLAPESEPAPASVPAEPEPEPEPADPVPEPEPVDPEPAPEREPAEPAPPRDGAPSAPGHAPSGRIEPSFDLPVDEELVAQPLPDDGSDVDPALSEPALSEPAPSEPALRAPAWRDAALPPPDAPAEHGADDGATLTGLPLRASAGAALRDATPMAASDAAAAAPRSARAKAVEARARRTKLTPTNIDAPRLRVADTDEPEFVKRSRKQEQSGRTRRILLAIGAGALALALAAQLVLDFRNVLAARYPGARPALGAACALLGCRVELPTQIDNLAIEDGELTTLGPDTYALNTLLRNQGSLVQAWPSIELELTDAANKPLLRRVFTPAEYLAPGMIAAGGFGGRSEQPVRLHFALADLKPSSYHIFIFYP
jgi:predicted Zn finger-like uncharacterized protein